jgi:beta-lactamase regulating signal transducer with metallopeptidase domain
MTTLLNSLCNGAILTGIVWLLLLVIPRQNAATRYAVWCMTLLAVVALPLWPVSQIMPASAGRAMTNVAAMSSPLPRNELPAKNQFPPPAPVAIPPIAPAPASSTSWHPIQLPARPVWLAVLFAWIAASAALLIRIAIGCESLRRLKRNAQPAPEMFAARAASLAAQAGVRRRVSLLTSDETAAPMTLGLFHPVILLPASLPAQIGYREFDHLILHELAHLRRYDDWLHLAQKVLEAVLPIQPAVFWIGRQIDLERETACDDWAVAQAGTPKAYAQSLTRIAELTHWACSQLLASGTVGKPSQLYQRVQRLLDDGRNRLPRIGAAPLAVAISLIAVLSWMSLYAPPVVALAQEAPAAAPAASPAPADSNPAASPAPAAAPTDPGTQTQSFNVAPGDNFAGDVDRGDVHIATWDQPTVQIVVHQGGRDLNQFLQHHTITMTQEGHTVRLHAFSDAWLSSHTVQVSVDYQITIPQKMDGTASDGLGDMDLTASAGRFDLSTGAGQVHITDTTGPVVARTGAGNLDANQCSNSLTATVGQGNVDINSFSGPSINSKTGMGNLHAELINQTTATSALSSGMGNVTVAIKDNIGLNLSVSSGMGRVDSDYPDGPISGGGPALSISTGMGNIRIKKQ